MESCLQNASHRLDLLYWCYILCRQQLIISSSSQLYQTPTWRWASCAKADGSRRRKPQWRRQLSTHCTMRVWCLIFLMTMLMTSRCLLKLLTMTGEQTTLGIKGSMSSNNKVMFYKTDWHVCIVWSKNIVSAKSHSFLFTILSPSTIK